MLGRLATTTLAAVLVAAGSTGCNATDHLTVAAASSIIEPLERLGGAALSPAGSQTLVAQVRGGAPLDAVVTADEPSIEALAEDGLLATDPVEIARTRLGLAVAEGNPLGLDHLTDLDDPGVRVVAAGEDVPLGRYTLRALRAAGLTVAVAARYPSAGGVLTAVAVGEADVAVVYETQRAQGVEVVPLPDVSLVVSYFAAVVAGTEHPDEAAEWLDALAGEPGRTVLAALGYEAVG